MDGIDIVVKAYDNCKNWNDNFYKGNDLYLIPGCCIPGPALNEARVFVQDFAWRMLDPKRGNMGKFHGTDSFVVNGGKVIIVWVAVGTLDEEIEGLVTALAEAFAKKEVPVEV